METNAGDTIQSSVLQRGNATSPYTVVDTDKVVEFTEAGDVVVALTSGKAGTTTTVLAGSRYAIGIDVKTITFNGIFSVS